MYQDSNKKNEIRHETNNWLTRFGDMMTLLLVFFVIQISPQAITTSKESEQKEKLNETLNQLEEIIKNENLDEKVTIEKKGNKAEISLDNTLLFDVGKDTLKKGQEKFIYPIIRSLIHIKDTHNINIEGHTDSLPVHNQKFKSNWYLSSARALTILDIFIAQGFDQKKLSAQGFAEFRPILPNKDINGIDLPKNRAKNRRVSIRIIGTDRLEVHD